MEKSVDKEFGTIDLYTEIHDVQEAQKDLSNKMMMMNGTALIIRHNKILSYRDAMLIMNELENIQNELLKQTKDIDAIIQGFRNNLLQKEG